MAANVTDRVQSISELVEQTSKSGGVTVVTATRITSFAPQLLVDDLERAIKFYSEVLGFSFGPTWRGFYAIGERDGFAVHLKCAPKTVEDRITRRQNEHLDVYANVIGVDALYAACKAKGATILKPLDRTAWGTSDFYLEDPEGYIIAFGETDNSN
jgi:predicted enzyme related to lactoylglutathione lyase